MEFTSHRRKLYVMKSKRFKCLLILEIVLMQKFSLCLYLAVKHVL